MQFAVGRKRAILALPTAKDSAVIMFASQILSTVFPLLPAPYVPVQSDISHVTPLETSGLMDCVMPFCTIVLDWLLNKTGLCYVLMGWTGY